MSLEMKVGDLEPAMVMTVADGSGLADFAQVVSWRILGHLNGAVVVDDAAPAVVVDPDNSAKATLTHTWVAGETDARGSMRVVAVATWPGTPVRPQTFPAIGYETVLFHATLS